ncbi:MAG: hypothetical protein ACI9H6_000135 [Patiriisocius sp.]|jgi:hypothetical protein
MLQAWRTKQIQRRKKRKKAQPESLLRTQVIVGVCIVLAISLLGAGVWYGSRIAALQITEVSVVGGFTIPHSEIEDKVWERLTGSYVRFVPYTFAPTYPKKAIIEHLYSIDRVKNVHIETLQKQKIVVAFDEYQPHALWCTEVGAKGCLFLDETGFAFGMAPDLTGSAFIRYTNPSSVPERKTQGFETAFIKESQAFADLLAKELDLYVVHVEKFDDLDSTYTVSGGGVLKVSQLMDIELSFNNLKSILSSEQFIHLQNGAFQYIDLRFGDKIFLNEEDEIEKETATSSEAAGI